VSFFDVLNFLDVLSGSACGTRPGPASARPGPVRRRRRAGRRRRRQPATQPRRNQSARSWTELGGGRSGRGTSVHRHPGAEL